MVSRLSRPAHGRIKARPGVGGPMANRSYLYAFDPGAPPRDLSEWKSEVPVTHLLLVSGDPTPVKSEIWSVEHRVALRGDAQRGRAVLGRLLDWLEPQMPAD